jgi:hypothetical protein
MERKVWKRWGVFTPKGNLVTNELGFSGLYKIRRDATRTAAWYSGKHTTKQVIITLAPAAKRKPRVAGSPGRKASLRRSS